MALTRFSDRESGKDGPVSGALQIIHIPVAADGANSTYRVNLPAGMSFEITDAEFTADTISSGVNITIGDTAAGTQVVASVTVATDTGALTIKDGTIDAGGFADIVFTVTGSETITGGDLTLVGYVSAPPTSVPSRGTA